MKCEARVEDNKVSMEMDEDMASRLKYDTLFNMLDNCDNRGFFMD